MSPEVSYRPLTQVPRLSVKERDRRWAAIRQEMALKEIDCLLVFSHGGSDGTGSANMRYVTHVGASGAALFPLQGDPVVFCGLPQTSGFFQGSQDWVTRFPGGPRPEEVAATIKEMGYEKGRVGVVGFGSVSSRLVPETVPYSPFLKIQKLLPEAVFTNESTLLERLRLIKSEEELAMIEKAAEMASLMFQAMVDTARPGRTECELYANMLAASLAQGGDLSNVFLDVGQTPLLHGRLPPYSQRPIEKGDMVITEYHGSYGGYMVGVEHSLSIGEPDARYREIHQVCEAVFATLLANLKPGVPMKQIVEAMRKPVADAGMTYIEAGIHGHGLGSPEFPTVVFGGPNCLVKEHPMGRWPPVIIRENMVFGVNIDVDNPKWRPNSGLMAGDTLVVTKSGARKLTRVPIELTVV